MQELEYHQGMSKELFKNSVTLIRQYLTLMEGSLGGLVRNGADKGVQLPSSAAKYASGQNQVARG